MPKTGMARFTFKAWKETRLRHCTQCDTKRMTPCSTICRAFSDRTEDQIQKQKTIQAHHQLEAIRTTQ